MNLEDVMLSEMSPSQDGTARFHLYELSKVVKPIEAGSRTVGARGWGGRRKEGVAVQCVSSFTYAR